jgi:hypothetical protein
MAITVEKAARGNAPATGMQKSKAPTRPAPPDAVSHVRAPTAQSYGENGPLNNQSRLNPGERMESDLGKSMAVDDPVMDRLLSRTLKDAKASGNDIDLQSPQTRDIGRDFPPVHSAMAKRGPDVGSPGTTSIPSTTVPGKTGDFDVRRQLGIKRTD